jgi:hypothetical protein
MSFGVCVLMALSAIFWDHQQVPRMEDLFGMQDKERR